MSKRNTTLVFSMMVALAAGLVQSAEAGYPDNASRNDAITSAASKRNFTLVGTGDGSPGCTSERPSVSLDECEAVADSLDGEVMHRGSWEWAPKGCHWNTKHGSVWFNEHLEGSHSNTNYTSICAMDSSGDDGPYLSPTEVEV